jgi:LysM repeat protein
MKRIVPLLLIVGTASATPSETADTVTIRAKQNDSVSMLASEFYGDRNKFPYIIAENRFTKPRPLVQGQRLRIPILREITTAPNDTFQSLAETLLGDPRRGGFLAEANQLSADDSLAAGTPLIVPFTVTHTADNRETLAHIAATYYSEPKFGEILKSYNFLDKAVLDKGEAITIPSLQVKVHPAKIPPPDAESKARRERRRDNTRLAASAIPVARHAWRIGDYAMVKKQLIDIDVAFVEVGPAVEVGVLLGSAQIAFGEADKALVTFRSVLDRKPTHTLRKVDHSPKVLAVWKKADGQVE